jgi:hypothetical protein
MALRVVPDLEAIAVELRDLVPGHVVRLVGREIEPFGDEERRGETAPQECWAHDGELRLHRVVERQDDEPVGDGLESRRRSTRRERQHGRAKRQEHGEPYLTAETRSNRHR